MFYLFLLPHTVLYAEEHPWLLKNKNGPFQYERFDVGHHVSGNSHSEVEGRKVCAGGVLGFSGVRDRQSPQGRDYPVRLGEGKLG